MTRSSQHHSSIFVFAAAALLLGAVAAPRFAYAGDGLPPARALQQAWRRAAQAGTYHFSTEVVQTTFPAPAVVNVGRSPSEETVYLEGQVDLSARTLDMGLWQGGGGVADPRSGIELRIEGDRAFGRPVGGTWQEVEAFSAAFAPGSDHLAYLAGAKNVRTLGTETRSIPPADVQGEPSASKQSGIVYRFTRYGFELDGLAFAQHMRDQLERYLRERGELPLGLRLDSSRVYQNTTGEGEL